VHIDGAKYEGEWMNDK